MTRKCSDVRKFLCLDCLVDTSRIGEFYFVNTELWLSVVSSTDGMLCIGCLEARLGHQLTADDFTDAYINSPAWASGQGRSDRLRDRMTRKHD
jgi:hypothetical protein